MVEKETMVVQAKSILGLLLAKHHEDITVPECKTGPSQCVSGSVRFDLWTMKRSYTKPCITGYEIKTSRADFMQDDKWMAYLPHCNEFYFVAPFGIITPEEISPEAGLMVCAKTGSRLFKKKKAPWRQIDEPVGVYQYILMSRASIGGEYEQRSNESERWKRWMAKRDEDKELGYNVSRKISELVSERIEEVNCENHKMKKMMGRYDEIKKCLLEMGFDEFSVEGGLGFNPKRRLEEKIREISNGIGEHFVQFLKQAGEKATMAYEMLAEQMGEETK